MSVIRIIYDSKRKGWVTYIIKSRREESQSQQ